MTRREHFRLEPFIAPGAIESENYCIEDTGPRQLLPFDTQPGGNRMAFTTVNEFSDSARAPRDAPQKTPEQPSLFRLRLKRHAEAK